MQKRGTQNSFLFSSYEPGMFEIHTARFHSTAARLWILMNFVLVSVILSEWRDRQRSPRCLICPRWVPTSSSNPLCCCSTNWLWPPLTSPRCRIRRWWTKPPPTRRTTTPRMRRSWPPPPATSGPPCRTWTRNWTLSSKTFRSRATSRPLWTRTVFPRRLQVRLHHLRCFSPPAYVCILGWPASISQAKFKSCTRRICSLSTDIDFCCGTCITVLSQFPTALWPREQPPLCSGCRGKKKPNNLIWVTHELANTHVQHQPLILLVHSCGNILSFLCLHLSLGLIFLSQCKIMKLNTWRRLAPPPR